MSCDLPSYIEAQQFWETGKVAPLMKTYLQRSILIGVPLYVINGRPIESAKNALIASLAVEAYVLYKTRQILKQCPAKSN
tara:strand:- start:3641 stop:3880 length:240 start_codon:yes stop_codon:yes gene_type:complete